MSGPKPVRAMMQRFTPHGQAAVAEIYEYVCVPGPVHWYFVPPEQPHPLAAPLAGIAAVGLG